jgi:hypothetical protein
MAPTHMAAPYVAGFAPGAAPGGPGVTPDPGTGSYSAPGTSQGVGQQPPYTASYGAPPPPGAASGSAFPGSGPYSSGAYGSPVYGAPDRMEPAEHKHPVGAVVLIIIGIVLLLQTLGVFEQEWISRAWPVVIIGVGAWLLYRRTRDTPRGGA